MDCVNTPGSFECVCWDGYMLDADGNNCIDVDECLNPDSCGETELCANHDGHYSCYCAEGFRQKLAKSKVGGWRHECVDIDECEKWPCEYFEECVNSPGSYTCECPSGFEMSYPRGEKYTTINM